MHVFFLNSRRNLNFFTYAMYTKANSHPSSVTPNNSLPFSQDSVTGLSRPWNRIRVWCPVWHFVIFCFTSNYRTGSWILLGCPRIINNPCLQTSRSSRKLEDATCWVDRRSAFNRNRLDPQRSTLKSTFACTWSKERIKIYLCDIL